MGDPVVVGPVVVPLPPDLTRSTLLGPYGVTVDQVGSMVPHMHIPMTKTEPDANPTTVATVAGWVLTLSSQVNARLRKVVYLAAEYQSVVLLAANGIITDGAASYLAAAGHGTDAGYNQSSYSQILWDRYTTALTALIGQVDEWAALPGGPDDEDPLIAAPIPGPAWYFPPPTFGDGVFW